MTTEEAEYDADELRSAVTEDLIDMVHNCHNVITLIDDIGAGRWRKDERDSLVKCMDALRPIVIADVFGETPNNYRSWVYQPATASEYRMFPLLVDMINQIGHMDHALDLLTRGCNETPEGYEPEWWAEFGIVRLKIRSILFDLYEAAKRALDKVDGVKFRED